MIKNTVFYVIYNILYIRGFSNQKCNFLLYKKTGSPFIRELPVLCKTVKLLYLVLTAVAVMVTVISLTPRTFFIL